MKKDKKIIVLVVCIVIILVVMISLFIANLNHKDDIDKTTTTTITEKISKSKTIKDNDSNLSVYFDNFEYDDNVRLIVKKVENVTIDNVVSVYDIELVDSNNKKIEVKNANIQISIPFDNKENYTSFKVLYLSENNEVLDTIDASFVNGNVVFKATHLCRYAIVATKVEEKPQQEQTTTKKTTTKKVTTKKVTTKQPTTQKTTTNNTNTQPTTKAPTTTTTTTQKVKNYTIKVKTVDQYSPDRILSVYENGNMISVAAIKYNGVTLCGGDNMVVNMYEIEGISELTVVLKDGKSVTAKIQ